MYKITKWFYQMFDRNGYSISKTPMNCSFFYCWTHFMDEICIISFSPTIGCSTGINVATSRNWRTITIDNAHWLLSRCIVFLYRAATKCPRSISRINVIISNRVETIGRHVSSLNWMNFNSFFFIDATYIRKIFSM